MDLGVGLTHALVQGLVRVDCGLQRRDVRGHGGDVAARVPLGHVLLVLLGKDTDRVG